MGSSSYIAELGRRLVGRVALITGGASGIGESTARVFAHHGAKVLIADVQDELGQAVSHSIGPDSLYIHCDVADEDQVKNAVKIAIEKFGKLDIMFNNAGIVEPYKPRMVDTEKADVDRVLSVNVTGVFLGIKHASHAMIPARKGSIISTASVASCIGGGGPAVYTASKHAVLGLTKGAAGELGKYGIRVNCVSPYVIATPLANNFLGVDGDTTEEMMRSFAVLKGVTLKAKDIANSALFLASDESRYVSGQNLIVDGGFSTFIPFLTSLNNCS